MEINLKVDDKWMNRLSSNVFRTLAFAGSTAEADGNVISFRDI